MIKSILGAALVLLMLAACKPKPSGPNWVVDVQPDASPPPRADLVLAGTKIPVDLKVARRAKEFVIELSAFGEIIESEKYISTPEEFSLREALGEIYEPAITLLRPGLMLNEEWQWRGEISSGGVERKASANVFMANSPASPSTLPIDSVKVVVSLIISSGEGISAERGLTFYFVPKQGLLRRDFGHASTRIPELAPKEPQ